MFKVLAFLRSTCTHHVTSIAFFTRVRKNAKLWFAIFACVLLRACVAHTNARLNASRRRIVKNDIRFHFFLRALWASSKITHRRSCVLSQKNSVSLAASLCMHWWSGMITDMCNIDIYWLIRAHKEQALVCVHVNTQGHMDAVLCSLSGHWIRICATNRSSPHARVCRVGQNHI